MPTISAKNFGPIAEGSVELKPLTIFLGKNNTGKSYMAKLIYALLRTLRRTSATNNPAPALESELRRLFGPTGDLRRGRDSSRKLKIALNQEVPGSGIAFELPPNANYLQREANPAPLHEIAESLPGQCWHLPASRSWIAAASRYAPPPTATGAEADFARNWQQLTASKPRPCPAGEAIANAAEFLESSILPGSVIEVQGPSATISKEGINLPLRRASSAVSELAPLILFLKRLVNPGDLLIIEEPESRLHPMAQLQLARGLARLVNAGVMVLITTHGNNLIGQIDNLLSSSNVSRETMDELGLAPEECLYPKQVGAYGFRIAPERGGSVIDPLPVAPDAGGIEDQEYIQVIELLYDQAIALQRSWLK